MDRLLREAEGRLGRALEEVPIGITFMAPDGRYLEVNRRFCEWIGRSEAEILSLTCWDLIHRDDHPLRRAYMQEALAGGGRAAQCQLRFMRADGTPVWGLVSSTLILDDDGEPLLFFAQIQDLTHQKRTEREYESLLAGLSDLDEGVLVLDEGRVLYVNDALCRLNGYTRDELLAMPSYFDVIVPEEREPAMERLRRRLADGTLPERFETAILHKDGHRVEVEAAVKVLPNGGRPRLLAICRDVTERKRSERLIQESERRWRAVSELTSDLAYSYRLMPDEKTIEAEWVTDAFEEITGYTLDEIMGLGGWQAILHPDDAPVLLERFAGLARGKAQSGEVRIFTKSGEMKWLRLNSRPELDESGRLVRILGAAQDITKRRSAEEAARRGESRFRTLIKLAPDAMFLVGEDGIIELVNSKAEWLFGYTREEMLGHSVEMLLPERHRGQHERHRHHFAAGPRSRPMGEGLDLYARRKDGLEFPVEISLGPIDGNGHPLVAATVRDVTARKRDEQRLRENTARLLRAERLANLGSFEWNLETGSLVWSEELYRIYGRAPAAWQPTLEGFLSAIHAEDRDRVTKAVQDALAQGGRFAFRERIVRPDGSVRVLETDGEVTHDEDGAPTLMVGACRDVTAHALAESALRESEERFRRLAENAQDIVYRYRFEPEPAFEYVSPAATAVTGYTPEDHYADPELGRRLVHPEDAYLLERMRAGPVTEPVVLRWIRKDGQVIWTEQRNVPIFDDDGRMIAIEGIARDITAQKLTEDALRETGRRYAEAYRREREATDRLRALDEMKNSFLSAVSHELRTPLTTVLGFAETLVRRDLDVGPDETRDIARRIAAGAHRLEQLLSDLLDLDRLARGVVEPRRALVDVGGLARTVARQFVGAHPITVEVNPVVVALDRPKVERIVENLIANAIKHTPEGTPIWVRVGPQGPGALIAVEDAGPGVPEELRKAVFEPFRQGPSRRHHAPGTGVGLSLVAGFARLHGGRAWVEGSEAGGASFRVYLPGGSVSSAGPAADAG